MRLWVLLPTDPITDDRAYLLGRLQAAFDEVEVTWTSRTAVSLSRPAKRPHLILNLVSAKCRQLLEEVDRLADEFDIPVSPTSESAWRSEDKRTYLETYRDVSPPTWVVSNLGELAKLRSEIDADIVVKDPLGHGGNEVEKIGREENLELAERLIENSWNATGQLIVQPYMRGFSLGDKRALVQRMPDQNYKIVAHIGRAPPPNGWKSNIRIGGHTIDVDLSREEIGMALDLAKRSDLDMAVIDLATHEGRTYFIEVNSTYGGIIDYDLGRSGRGVDYCADYLVYLARYGRSGIGSVRLSDKAAERPLVHSVQRQKRT